MERQNVAKTTIRGASFGGQQIGQVNYGGQSMSVTLAVDYLTYIDDGNKRQRTIEWIAPFNFVQKQADVLANREPGTGLWFLQSEPFKQWIDGATDVLWCPGIRMRNSFLSRPRQGLI